MRWMVRESRDIDQPMANSREMRGLGGKFAQGWTIMPRILWAVGERR